MVDDRKIKHGRPTETPSSSYREFLLPSPYGHYAVKAWGSPIGFPILALHGWLDNAGSFDTLAPLLDPNYHLVCLEMPGHGLSSHKPSGQLYHFMEGLLDIRRVVEYFQWDKVALLGHRMGGVLALMFASLHPDTVQALIVLDPVMPILCKAKELTDRNRLGMEEILRKEMRRGDPSQAVYSQEEALKLLMEEEGLDRLLSAEAARILLRRAARPACDRDKLTLTRDDRLRDLYALSTITEETCAAYLQRVYCEVLLVVPRDSRSIEDLEGPSSLFERNCKRFQAAFVDGNGYVHLSHPERVAPIVKRFLESPQTLKSKI